MRDISGPSEIQGFQSSGRLASRLSGQKVASNNKQLWTLKSCVLVPEPRYKNTLLRTVIVFVSEPQTPRYTTMLLYVRNSDSEVHERVLVS